MIITIILNDVKQQNLVYSSSLPLICLLISCLLLLSNRTFNATISDVFNDRAGSITGYTLIVCELNPWLNNDHYHNKLQRDLPVYREVSGF